jgi:hypothetical protein
MPLFIGKKHETEAVLYSYEVVEDPTINPIPAENDPDATTTSGNHCAWCGDPPDRNGSHGICASHRAQMEAVSAARVERRAKQGRP